MSQNKKIAVTLSLCNMILNSCLCIIIGTIFFLVQNGVIQDSHNFFKQIDKYATDALYFSLPASIILPITFFVLIKLNSKTNKKNLPLAILAIIFGCGILNVIAGILLITDASSSNSSSSQDENKKDSVKEKEVEKKSEQKPRTKKVPLSSSDTSAVAKKKSPTKKVTV
ncbi:MAG: hypothetical protein LBB39_02010 [Mycoplasmataceae bacterium]|jgi:hypothetical protein|nr:hypothetical protein [Mycoplasmataceae bacterium]